MSFGSSVVPSINKASRCSVNLVTCCIWHWTPGSGCTNEKCGLTENNCYDKYGASPLKTVYQSVYLYI